MICCKKSFNYLKPDILTYYTHHIDEYIRCVKLWMMLSATNDVLSICEDVNDFECN